jgi:hypothetical protein
MNNFQIYSSFFWWKRLQNQTIGKRLCFEKQINIKKFTFQACLSFPVLVSICEMNPELWPTVTVFGSDG